MKEIDIQALKKELTEKIQNSTENVFLYLGGHHFPQEYLNDAETTVNDIESSASTFWTWQDTAFDNPDVPLGQEHYRQGGLLVQINKAGTETASPLLDHFLNVWAFEQKGVLLTSTYSGAELDLYLKSLLWMQGEGSEADKYAVNLQNPDFQTAWLHSFTEEKLQAFMGPISTIIWLDIYGYEMQWCIQTNKAPQLNAQEVGWYLFDNEQIAQFKKQEQVFLHKELVSHAFYLNSSLTASQAAEKAQETLNKAQAIGVTDYKSILLLHQARFVMSNNDDIHEIIKLLSSSDMPIDVRIELSESKINQAQQTTV